MGVAFILFTLFQQREPADGTSEKSGRRVPPVLRIVMSLMALTAVISVGLLAILHQERKQACYERAQFQMQTQQVRLAVRPNMTDGQRADIDNQLAAQEQDWYAECER